MYLFFSTLDTRPRFIAPGYYASHRYVGGEPCESVGANRTTEVRFFCCMDNILGHTMLKLDWVDEPAECVHTMRVCVLSLCEQSTYIEKPSGSGRDDNKNNGGTVTSTLPGDFLALAWRSVDVEPAA